MAPTHQELERVIHLADVRAEVLWSERIAVESEQRADRWDVYLAAVKKHTEKARKAASEARRVADEWLAVHSELEAECERP